MSAINFNYNLDNFGNMVPHPGCAHPKLASGQTLTATTAGTNYTATVKTARTYVVTATVGCMWFGLTGTVATAANREWICPKDGQIVIRVPETSVGATTTTLNFSGDTNLSIAYIVELAERA